MAERYHIKTGYQEPGRRPLALEFIDISHAYGGRPAVSDVSFVAETGDITCLLGPSGCGKTTLLRLAAGLIDLQQGELRLDGGALATPGNAPPPEARDIGLVFQEGALFPHMTVARNVGFGLEMRPDKAAVIEGVLRQLGLEDYGERYPHTLSGGQQQRVALGRALAPAPRVLLLDEPFANLDILRRRALRQETRRALKARESIAILVTHDPDEAMEVADRIAVMENGRIVQTGAPAEIYDAPASIGVGAMFGGGASVRGRWQAGGVETPFGLWAPECVAGAAPVSAALDLLVRPDAVDVSPVSEGEVRVEDVRLAGAAQKLLVGAPTGERLWAQAPREAPFAVGDSVKVSAKPGAVFAFAGE